MLYYSRKEKLIVGYSMKQNLPNTSSRFTRMRFSRWGALVLVLLLGITFLIAGTGFLFAQEAGEEADSLSELNQALSEKRREIQSLEDQQKVYQDTIAAQQQEQRTLKDEIALLDDEIKSTELEIQTTELEIESVKLELQQTQDDIAAREDEILAQKKQLAEFVKLAYRNAQRTYLEIALLNDSFSDFVRKAKYTESLESQLKKGLNRLRVLKAELEAKEADLEAGKNRLEAKQEAMESQQIALDEQVTAKSLLLDQSKFTEAQYQSLLDTISSDIQRVESEISSIEKRVRQKLREEGGDPLGALGDPVFSWPIAPTKGISTYFHDATYPFRYIFEHPGIDIPAAHGTEITAAADGVVAIARNLDWKEVNGIRYPAYNYVSLLHGDDFSTVYGHMSRVDVSEGEYVTKGQIIGAVGGTPWTAGAGTLTTGPHLHFEVRIGGIPDDPLKYLP